MRIGYTWRDIYHHGPMAFGLLLLAVILLICPLPSSARAEGTTSTTSSRASAQCNGLKPFNNLDELLYQFYINLDSGCLFTMPVEELEKIWGIKILDEERRKPKNYYPLSETEFYNKPYKSERDAFYIELVRNESGSDGFHNYNTDIFYIALTREGEQKIGTFFPEEKLPMVLPKPNLLGYSSRKPCDFPDIVDNRPYLVEEVCRQPMWASDDRAVRIAIISSNQIQVSNNKNLRKKKHSGSGQKNEELKDDTATVNKAASSAKDKENTIAKADLKTAPCRGLKPFSNVDELLYQFYINLDSDCLFKMPIEKLEKIWQVAIIQFDVDHSTEHENLKNDFYIAVSHFGNGEYRSFNLKAPKEYWKKHSSFFPNEKKTSPLPRYLASYGRDSTSYFWLNSDQTHIIEMSFSSYGLFQFAISNSLPPFFEKWEIQR